MPDLLIELFSEEIPARMQGRAAEDLKKLMTDAMVEAGLTYAAAAAFATPRRLCLAVEGLPKATRATREERKGMTAGLLTMMAGLAALFALPVGWGIALLLIEVINVRSFGWTMALHATFPALLLPAMFAIAAAIAASIYPAERVVRIDPAAALRDE